MFPLLFMSLRRAVKDGEEQNKQTNKNQDNFHKILN